jgi:tetrahydromethanopterin S-methyltransferase subunit D
MKPVPTIIGVTLMVVGAIFLLQAFHVLPGGFASHGRWTSLGMGCGAWGLAFGAGFLVWANSARTRP